MSKIYSILMLVTTFAAILSCENYRDNNGSLGGNWQLLEWRTRSTSGTIDSLVTDNNNDTLRLYWSIHRDVFQIRNAITPGAVYLFSYERTQDSIFLKEASEYYGKSLVDTSDPTHNYALFEQYGVPLDGRFQYRQNGDDNLILSSKNDILVFRRY